MHSNVFSNKLASQILKQIRKRFNGELGSVSKILLSFEQRRLYAAFGVMPEFLKNVPEQLETSFHDMVQYNFHKARLLVEDKLIGTNKLSFWTPQSKTRERQVIEFMTYLETIDTILEFNLATLKDSGDAEMISGYKVNHKEHIKPVNTGIRFSLDMDLDKALALATTMTFTCANINVPYGGSSAGLAIDPNVYSEFEIERIVRQYTNLMMKKRFFGPALDVPAPDLGTGDKEMKWIVDAYRKTFGCSNVLYSPFFTSEKPFNIGGLHIYKQSQGKGIFFCLNQFTGNEKMMKEVGLKTGLTEKTFIIEGFGTVGAYATLSITRAGAKCIGIQEVNGSIINIDGINPEELMKFKLESKTIIGFPGAQVYEGKKLIYEACDILIFASKEKRLNKDDVPEVKAKIIVEGSIGAVTPSAEKHLLANKVLVIPDILAASGGIIVSYVEWYKNIDFSYYEFTNKYNRGRTLAFLGAVEGSLQRQDMPVKITPTTELLNRIREYPRDGIVDSSVEYGLERASGAIFDISEDFNLGLDIRTAGYINGIHYIIRNFNESALMGFIC